MRRGRACAGPWAGAGGSAHSHRGAVKIRMVVSCCCAAPEWASVAMAWRSASPLDQVTPCRHEGGMRR